MITCRCAWPFRTFKPAPVLYRTYICAVQPATVRFALSMTWFVELWSSWPTWYLVSIQLANMTLEIAQWFIVGFLFILPLLYELSSSFRYYAKISLHYTCIMSTAIVVMCYAVFKPGDVRNHWFVYFLITLPIHPIISFISHNRYTVQTQIRRRTRRRLIRVYTVCVKFIAVS